jgi:hypothetical protein
MAPSDIHPLDPADTIDSQSLVLPATIELLKPSQTLQCLPALPSPVSEKVALSSTPFYAVQQLPHKCSSNQPAAPRSTCIAGYSTLRHSILYFFFGQ